MAQSRSKRLFCIYDRIELTLRNDMHSCRLYTNNDLTYEFDWINAIWTVMSKQCAAAALLIVVLANDPVQAQKQLDLANFVETYSERFRGPLDVTPWGPSRWIAHTPWAGDFGDARFADPREGFPFKTGPNGLTITARKDRTGRWESGLLSSRDPKRRGFAQAGGYFEARMKMPRGPGVWPAFWLVSEGDGAEKIEIDIVEYYGHRTDQYHQNIHVWSTINKKEIHGDGNITKVPEGSLVRDFHNYGVEVTEHEIVFYFDRKEVWRTKAPPSARQPVMLLVNLALGSGWPIDNTPNPSVLSVDYVKVYRRIADR